MTRPARRAALTLAMLGSALLAACSSGGQPLNFGASAVDMAGAGAYPGQAVSYSAVLAARPPGPTFTVTRVTLIPLPGFRTPRLVGALFLLEKSGFPDDAQGFPPYELNSPGHLLPAHALAGYTVSTGGSQRQPQVLMYGIAGDKLGPYACAGINLTYALNGTSYTAQIYNGAFLYYSPRHDPSAAFRRSDDAAYSADYKKAVSVLNNLPGTQTIKP